MALKERKTSDTLDLNLSFMQTTTVKHVKCIFTKVTNGNTVVMWLSATVFLNKVDLGKLLFECLFFRKCLCQKKCKKNSNKVIQNYSVWLLQACRIKHWKGQRYTMVTYACDTLFNASNWNIIDFPSPVSKHNLVI